MAVLNAKINTGKPPFQISIFDVSTGASVTCLSGCVQSTERTRVIEFIGLPGTRTYRFDITDGSSPACISHITRVFDCDYPDVTVTTECRVSGGVLIARVTSGVYPAGRFAVQFQKSNNGVYTQIGSNVVIDNPSTAYDTPHECPNLTDGLYRIILIDLQNGNTQVSVTNDVIIDCVTDYDDPSAELDGGGNCPCDGLVTVEFSVSSHNGNTTGAIYTARILRDDQGYKVLADSVKIVPPQGFSSENTPPNKYLYILPKTGTNRTVGFYKFQLLRNNAVLQEIPFSINCTNVTLSITPSLIC